MPAAVLAQTAPPPLQPLLPKVCTKPPKMQLLQPTDQLAGCPVLQAVDMAAGLLLLEEDTQVGKDPTEVVDGMMVAAAVSAQVSTDALASCVRIQCGWGLQDKPLLRRGI